MVTAVSARSSQRADDRSEQRQTCKGVGRARADDQLCESHRPDGADAFYALGGIDDLLDVRRMHRCFEITARGSRLVRLSLNFPEDLSESSHRLELSNLLGIVPVQVADTGTMIGRAKPFALMEASSVRRAPMTLPWYRSTLISH